MKQLLLAAFVLLAAGCPSGLEPPSVTQTVVVPGGTFRLGPPHTSAGPQLDCGSGGCDAGAGVTSWMPDVLVKNLPSFRMDVHEVTNFQYEYCVAMGACTPPAVHDLAGEPYFEDDDWRAYPMVNVTAEQAAAYCSFVGKRLPTEAQWERAARYAREAGSAVMRAYPWKSGQTPVCDASSSAYLPTTECKDIKRPEAAGTSSVDVSFLLIKDMAGNVAEWVLDEMKPNGRCATPAKDDCDGNVPPQCKQACQGAGPLCLAGTYQLHSSGNKDPHHLVKGSGYMGSRCQARLFTHRDTPKAGPDIGFRCVADEPGSTTDSGMPDAGPPDAVGGTTDSGADAPGGGG